MPHPTTLPAPTDAPGTPLWGAYAFTFLSSIGTGVVTSGIYFLTTGGYGFSQVQNYGLGVVMGLAYIAGAAAAGPAAGALRRRFGLTTRSVLAGITGGLGVACALPALAGLGRGAVDNPATGGWVVWLTVVIYNPLSGALWPIVESYVSGGRPGPALCAAIGRWNIVWSVSLVLAFWGLAPLVEHRGTTAILLLGLIHLGSLALLLAFGREPEAHSTGGQGPRPDSYPRLLSVFRLLLPTAFMVLSALSPYLPGAMARLGVAARWAPILATAWLLARVAAFVALERGRRWHGSWAMPVVGGLLLLGGFAMSVLAPSGLGAEWPPALHTGRLAVQVVGLALFGVGVAVIYAGAVYYAMEVGQAEVHAGGKHESLIGVGYTVGPFIGLLASLAARRGLIAPEHLEWGILAPVAAMALLMAGLAYWRAWRGSGAAGG